MLRLSSACALTAALLAGCGTDSEPTSPSPIGKGDGFGSAGLVLINEIAPNPDLDVNGDGSIDVGDEYIEVVNSGQQPMDLTGVAIRDAVGVRFQFPDGATLSANSAAVVIARRKNFDPPAGVDVYEAGVLGLNNTNDTVQLLRNGSVEENHGYNQGDSQDTWQRMPDGHPGGVFFPRAPTPGLRSDGTEFGANLLSDDSSRKVLDSLHDECPDTFCGGDFSYHFDVPTGATLTCAGDGTCTISGQATPFQGERWVPGSVSALSEADKVSVASNGSVRARLTGETERDSSVHDGEVLVDFACELSGDFFSARAVVD
ncbi:MAG: lamin tail domain-containing protein, partial [Deltaproteobacteria bacterium]|nr:lamin tail domain-containing protein [Deltaproteobacteria bacterium]